MYHTCVCTHAHTCVLVHMNVYHHIHAAYIHTMQHTHYTHTHISETQMDDQKPQSVGGHEMEERVRKWFSPGIPAGVVLMWELCSWFTYSQRKLNQ